MAEEAAAATEARRLGEAAAAVGREEETLGEGAGIYRREEFFACGSVGLTGGP